MILGVTGGIATGKSTVTKMLAEKGAIVVSADELSRQLVVPGSPVLLKLVQRFGAEILNEGGTLNRQKLADMVFSDPVARKDLEKVMHPAIALLAQQRLAQAVEKQQSTGGLVVYEAPLLYEAGAESRVDKVLAVIVDSVVQLKRLQQRDQCDATTAKRRVDSQMSQHEKARRADYVIDNSKSILELQHQIDEVYRGLCLAGRRA
ncbi:MAG: dephospho-CoA kinase [Desulfobacteraceae bacterium 4572_35.2]|nr:MAG: dephospho-CoA kinase [Desulfobacteraceae bacterium 4572_35.2]